MKFTLSAVSVPAVSLLAVSWVLLGAISPLRAAAPDSTELFAESLLFRLCDSLLALQDRGEDPDDSNVGGIRCPSRNPLVHGFHTRAAEAVFPFLVCAERTAERAARERYVKAAISLGEWLISRQQSDGSWLESPHRWWGTTAHELLSLAAGRISLEGRLGKDADTRWLNAIRRAADFLALKIRPESVPVSYLPTTACALTLSARLLPSRSLRGTARRLVEETLERLNDEGLFLEEKRGVIDVGIDLGQTIPMLALYAVLTEDEALLRRVEVIAEEHLPFLFPDGTVAASWGGRCHRWTVWGSFGTLLPGAGFALLGRESAVMREAAKRNLAYVSSCFR